MSVARPDTWMPMYWGDYTKDTADLSALEHGAYLMLIAHYWCKASPLPMDDGKLARIAKCTPSEWSKIKTTVLGFFEAGESVYRHKRVDHELSQAKSKYERRANSRGNFQRNKDGKRRPNLGPDLGPNHGIQSQSQYPSDIAREARGDASQGVSDPTRDLTPEEMRLATEALGTGRRYGTNADVAGWRAKIAERGEARKVVPLPVAPLAPVEPDDPLAIPSFLQRKA